jgi:hypothetical protein
MADDQVRVIFDHLLLLPKRPAEQLDLFIASNGGSGTVPWRLVSLLREFATRFCVLIPYRAYSAASLVALGADQIVMHPFAELGPIDPTVMNEFNPEKKDGSKVGISVEDVKAYVDFVKSTVGITHEDELVQMSRVLAEKVHPLALGNVERFLSQSRMIARKILRTHMKSADDHQIDEIVENMASKLYFHGHPINRREAKEDLKLEVATDLQPGLESALWTLYTDFEQDFKNAEIFDPQPDLNNLLATNQQPMREYDLLLAAVESMRLSSHISVRQRFTLVVNPQSGERTIQMEQLDLGWKHSKVPEGDAQRRS